MSLTWKTLPGEMPALAQGPETLFGWKSPQLGQGTEPLHAGDVTCPLLLSTVQQSSAKTVGAEHVPDPRACPTSPVSQWTESTLSFQNLFPC